jgi:hypothetical protein
MGAGRLCLLKNADCAHLAGVDQVRGLFSLGLGRTVDDWFAGSVASFKNGLSSPIIKKPNERDLSTH